MRWVRSRLWFGSWSALLALAIQLALSFGHLHVEDTSARSTSIPFALRLVIEAPAATPGALSTPAQQKPTSLADDFCAICAVIRLVGVPTPAPILPLPLGSRFISVDVDVEFELAASPHLFFRARAPPHA
jgi:hypothetical protein